MPYPTGRYFLVFKIFHMRFLFQLCHQRFCQDPFVWIVQWHADYGDLLVPADSDFFFMVANETGITIMEAYKKATNLPMLTHEYANWSPTNGLVVSHGTEKYERRSLSGVQIRVGSLEVGDLTHFGKQRIF